MNIWKCNKCGKIKYDEPKQMEFCNCGGKFISELLPYNNYLPQNVGKVDLRKLLDKGKKTSNYSAKVSGDYLRNKKF